MEGERKGEKNGLREEIRDGQERGWNRGMKVAKGERTNDWLEGGK